MNSSEVPPPEPYVEHWIAGAGRTLPRACVLGAVASLHEHGKVQKNYDNMYLQKKSFFSYRCSAVGQAVYLENIDSGVLLFRNEKHLGVESQRQLRSPSHAGDLQKKKPKPLVSQYFYS